MFKIFIAKLKGTSVASHLDQPNSSGLHDFDYPSLIEAGLGLEALPEVTSVKRLPLPPELTEQFDRILYIKLEP